MSSGGGMKGIRQVRRKKSALSEVKIAVLGAPGVGKSALTVRFLTKRYIGEYDHQGDSRYKQEVMVDGDAILFEICDTCTKELSEMPSVDILSWADGLVLVYSITERDSFTYIKQVWKHIQDFKAAHGKEIPMVILGNKEMINQIINRATDVYGDMVHLRQVSSEEGDILAKDVECSFSEVAAADQVTEVADAFYDVCREVNTFRRKNKTSLLDRVLGNKGGIRAYSRGKSDSSLSKY